VKISGFQYYWFITFGLFVGIALAVVMAATAPFSTGDPTVVIPLLIAYLYAAVAMFVVALEIWDRHGFGIALLAFIIFPSLFIYWLSRIGGVSDEK